MSQGGPTRAGLCWTAGALMLLLVATVALAYLKLGVLGPVLAIGIAGVKALLVALLFMHLRYGSPTARLFALAGIFWFGILLSLTLADVLTRT